MMERQRHNYACIKNNHTCERFENDVYMIRHIKLWDYHVYRVDCTVKPLFKSLHNAV